MVTSSKSGSTVPTVVGAITAVHAKTATSTAPPITIGTIPSALSANCNRRPSSGTSAGPDIRWCGNEGGSVGETNWSLYNYKQFVPGEPDFKQLRVGIEDGKQWIPSEVNVSIRPGWFYHKYEDAKVKKLPQLLDIFYNSIGRNGTWLLNFPIDKEGRIHANDERAVLELRKALDEAFADDLARKAKAEAGNVRGGSKKYAASKAIDGKKDTYWATDDGVTQSDITFTFKKPTTLNRVLLQEYIRLGQRVKSFKVEANVDGQWRELARETTIGYKRILRLPTVTATQVRISILDAKACPLISNIGIYNAPQVLTEPQIVRHPNGEVIIRPADGESAVFYTLDGTDPTTQSLRYTGPFMADGVVTVSAVSVDMATGKQSTVSREEFGMSRTKWKVIAADANAARVIDGESWPGWHQRGMMPADLVIDLGESLEIKGFRYLPDQSDYFPSGIITFYEFYVSDNGSEWKLVSEGEFSNIRNNPSWQMKEFAPVKTRFVKLRALNNTQGDKVAGYSEFDVLISK